MPASRVSPLRACPRPVAGRSLRAPALRSLDADCAPPSWLRWSATPAPGARAAPRFVSPVAQVANLCRATPQVANLRLLCLHLVHVCLTAPRSTGFQPVPSCTAGCQPAATWLHLVHVCLTAPRSTGCQPVPCCTAGCQPAATWLHLVHVCLTAPRSTGCQPVPCCTAGCQPAATLPARRHPMPYRRRQRWSVIRA